MQRVVVGNREPLTYANMMNISEEPCIIEGKGYFLDLEMFSGSDMLNPIGHLGSSYRRQYTSFKVPLVRFIPAHARAMNTTPVQTANQCGGPCEILSLCGGTSRVAC
jgi:hypothetical protein